MKIFIVIIAIFFSQSCSNTGNIEIDKTKKTFSLDWLQGEWIRTNDEIGKHTFENWQKIDSHNYVGLGCTLENSDTTFKENLKLTKINGTWTLEVRGVNSNMTPFIVIEQTDSSFICQNPTNDFPKNIEYLFHNNILTARISDEKTEIKFIFGKTD